MFIVLLIIISGVKEITPSDKDTDSKIVGGRALSSAESIPFIVSVQIKDSGHNCGGSLLSPNYVLTACHCLANIDTDQDDVQPLSIDSFDFVAGLIKLSDSTHAQLRKAKEFYIHPNCGRAPWKVIVYDFSLGEMKKPFTINKYVKPFKLLSSDPEIFKRKMYNLIGDPDVVCQVAGWGVTERGYVEKPVASDMLNLVRMYVIPETKCQKLYGLRNPKFGKFPFSKYNQICTISFKGDSSDCQGDSGGPFFCDDYVIGVISYGFECGTPMPNVYTSLTDFLKWFSTHEQRSISKPIPTDQRPSNRDSTEGTRDSIGGVEENPAEPRKTNGELVWRHSIWLILFIVFRSWFPLISP
uniref:trypsin n=1 Tax=Lygus hesperus TaxID=30085 RepID=A0A0A9Y164_LYGHE